MDIGCPVSRKFPHGTFHYQSRKVFVFFSRRSYFFRSASRVRIYSFLLRHLLFYSGTGLIFFLQFLFTFFDSPRVIRISNFARHYFRSLGWFLYLVLRCFNSQAFFSFFVCFRMYGTQVFLGFDFNIHSPSLGLSQCLTPFLFFTCSITPLKTFWCEL